MQIQKQLILWASNLNGWLWDHFLIVLVLAVCAYFTFRLKGVQFRYLGYCLQLAAGRKDPHAQGEITPFASMMTSLAGTLGIGSIVGVSTAVIMGGFGAVFWMLLIAFFGLAVRYAEALLAVKYRTVNHKKEVCGGPMYYMAYGLKKKWLAICFALFGALAACAGGIAIPSRGMALIARDAMHLPEIATGICLCAMTALIMTGGIRRIALFSSFVASAMAILYGAGGLIILIAHLDSIPHALFVMFTSAFSTHAISGGVLGASLSAVIHLGMTWGITSHHIGWGSSSIAAAAAKTDVPGRQALIVMGGFFLSIVMSAITALVLFVTDAPALIQSSGAVFSAPSFVMQAFRSVIPGGDILVMFVLVLFGFTAIIGWGYYGEKCMEFLSGRKAVLGYRVLLCAFALMGSVASLEILWPLSSCINGLMALCNSIALIALSSVVAIETRMFFDLVAKEKRQRNSAEINLN